MIRVSENPFDPAAAIADFEQRAGDAGAVAAFLGKVRGRAEGETVDALYLEHYPGVTEKSIREIEAAARRRWRICDTLIIHRVGRMVEGEAIVLVCAAAAHRRDAFEAVDFLMDYLKTNALFWKKEIRKTREVWIEPRAEDYEDVKRWAAEQTET